MWASWLTDRLNALGPVKDAAETLYWLGFREGALAVIAVVSLLWVLIPRGDK